MTAAITPLTYRPFTREELESLPADTIVAQTWSYDSEPELYKKSRYRPQSPWLVLTASPQNYDWERWSTDELHSEHALYAVVYQPAVPA